MAKIVVTENVSLDGVVQDPTGEEGLGRGSWTGQISDQDRAEWARALFEDALGADALLLGRRSDAWFAARWLCRDGEWADRLNGLPKYVVSATLDSPRWSNATVLRGDAVTEVCRLRQELDGTVVVYASGQLVRTLVDHDLVDELRLMIYPAVIGAGEHLFAATSDPKLWRLSRIRTVGESLAYLTYERGRDA